MSRDDDVAISPIFEAMDSSAVLEVMSVQLFTRFLQIDVTEIHRRILVTRILCYVFVTVCGNVDYSKATNGMETGEVF